MADYKLLEGGVQRISDGACIPAVLGNRDYQEYLVWVDEGGVPDPQYTLTEYKELKRLEINQKRDDELNKTDTTVFALLPDSTSLIEWSLDPTSKDALNRVLTVFSARGSLPNGMVWRDNNNINHDASLELLYNIADAGAYRENLIWVYSWTLKASLESASTTEEVDAIVWNFTE